MSWRPNHWTERSCGSFFLAMSVRRPAAGDIEYAGGGERAVIRSEPAGHGGDLLDFDEAPHRDLGEHELREFGRDLVEDRGLRRGGRHAVDEHAGLRQLLAERLGEGDEAALRRGVGG